MSDGISALLRLLIRAVGAGYPMRLVFGASGGAALKIVLTVAARHNPESAVWNAFNEFSVLWYVIIVTPLLFMPIIFGRRGALEQVAHHVDTLRLFIDQAKFLCCTASAVLALSNREVHPRRSATL